MVRRKEFKVKDEYQQDVIQFINEMNYGVLAMQGKEGFPIVVPLNYVYLNDAIYFHGSKLGEKMEVLTHVDKATFAITEEFATIPSYLEDSYFACPATTFFKSVIIYGHIKAVEDERLKHEVLNELMKKLQPEGGYSPIVYEDESYRKRVKATAVIELTIDKQSAKFKFGQNWKEEKHEKVKAHLNERQNELDIETIKLMERYCPYHGKQK